MAHTGRRGHVSIDRRWLNDPTLTDSALRLMLWLDSHTDAYLAELDKTRTAKEMGWTRDRVSRALTVLESLDLVTCVQVPHSNIGTRTQVTVHLDVWTSSALPSGAGSALSSGAPVPYDQAPSTSKCNSRNSAHAQRWVPASEPPTDGVIPEWFAAIRPLTVGDDSDTVTP